MTGETRFYERVVNRLIRGSGRAILGLRGFRNEPLREYLGAQLEQPPGEGQSVLADPVFEAAFGWEQAECTLGSLKGRLLHGELVNALSRPVQKGLSEDYAFPESRSPYMHQLQSWKALSDRNVCRSVLVTSGTGSGKTECFLIPILNDLAHELTEKQDGSKEGVRAIFLYPLNALIKSQKERLQAWTEPFNGRIRFCLYNGDTPEQARTEWQCEVPSRRGLRECPPQILVTNPTMLEYMLVRSEDRPVVEKSQGRLRWIVIDEAHTYLGSQAAELTLLLRRTMHAFGCTPGEVHLVATSATIGNDSEESKLQLARFLADLAGVSEEQVFIVAGRRECPRALDGAGRKHSTPPNLTYLHSLSDGELYQVVSQEPTLLRLRDALVERPRTLSELSQLLLSRVDADSKELTIALIDVCVHALDSEGRAFLPLRAHLFHRTLPGLWACANSECPEKAGSLLDDKRWPFGQLYFERRERCSCGTPVFDLVQCGTCGAEYLSAEEVASTDGQDVLRPRTEQSEEDEFQEELEPIDAGADQMVESAIKENNYGVARERLLTNYGNGIQVGVGLRGDGTLDWDGKEGACINLRIPDERGLSCAVCHDQKSDNYPIAQFRPVRIGAPFLLTSTTPSLLSMLKPWGSVSEARPMDGRRLVTFTDSRQGTARTVVKSQQQVERDYVGSLLYHSLASLKRGASTKDEIEKKKLAVYSLRELIVNNPSLQPVLEQQEQELEKLQIPGDGNMTWSEAAEKLQSSEDFKRWMRTDLFELSYSQLQESAVADLCLYREFFLRPRRQYSLEGLGLAQLVYPKLKESNPPALLQQRGINSEEWVSLLRLSVDAFIRSGSPSVEIPEYILRWLGYPGKPSTLLPPNAKRYLPTQRYWPSTQSSHAKRNRLIRLVSHALNLSLDSETDRHFIDEVMGAMWAALVKADVLLPVEGGYQINLKRSSEIHSVSEAWLCPVTRRLLPVSFKSFTPYLPELPVSDDLAKCKKVTMPALPHPFWQGSDANNAEAWLESDVYVSELRKLGVWNDISDRIARFSRYFRSAEHSAQLSGAELTQREREFKDGRLNLLSCSTTMEMGVDIGGLSAVAMNNVPPHPANFLQRAGRAGRRGEASALSFTLCKATPHGEAVFRNPLWPFSAQLATPRVDLRSEPIVQRHINALSLATFLQSMGPDSIPRLRTGWFFECEDEGISAPVERFVSWCEDANAWPKNLSQGVESLIKGSSLDGVTVVELLSRTAEMMDDACRRWLAEIEGLLEQQKALKTRDGRSMPEVAIAIRLDRWRREYLLGQLASLAFLPGYGFPSGVVPLVTTTAESVASVKRRKKKDDREDNRQRRAGFPTRDLAVAIRDYAPGTDTVLAGRVYRSEGVTLNWQLPVEADRAPEIQDLRWIWRCRQCGSNGARLAMPDQCPHCGNSDKSSLILQRMLQPSGFAVDFRAKSHNDISVSQYIPVREPLISIEGAEWMLLPDARLGRYRSSSSGQLIHHSDGLYGNGYSLCLRCGRAGSVTASDERPGSLDSHKRLQGGKLNDSERMCPGNEESWAIIDGLRLGAMYSTEIFELQLRDTMGKPIQDRTTAYTFAVSLRRAFCATIGIEEAEIGATASEGRDQDGSGIYSIYLFDTASGGAGYSSQIPHLLPELVRRVRDEVLNCPNKCDSACQACILTYETQHHIEHLDRHKVLHHLTNDFLDALELPVDLCVFGPQSRLELEPLPLALDREWQRWKFNEINLYLGGKAGLWEPLQWRLLDSLRRYHQRGVEVFINLEQGVVERLEQSQRDELYVICSELKAKLKVVSEKHIYFENRGLVCVVEVGNALSSVRWAASDSSALQPDGLWGTGDAGATYIRSPRLDKPLDRTDDAVDIHLDELRSRISSGITQLEINNELTGLAHDFGDRAWEVIVNSVPDLEAILKSSSKIVDLSYTDRYLRSPLSILLVERLIGALQKFPGGLNNNSRVSIFTTGLGKPHKNFPRAWSHDWQDRQDRDEVVVDLLGSRFSKFEWKIRVPQELPHARLMSIQWDDGKRWQLRFDQGVGYWKEATHSGNDFPFMASPVSQVKHMRDPSVSVRPVSQEFSTFFYAVRG